MGVKLKFRVAATAVAGCFLLLASTALLYKHDMVLGHLARKENSEIFYRTKAEEHLIAPRVLVDKSSFPVSNLSSGEYSEAHKINNVPEDTRRKFLFKKEPTLEVDASRDYTNLLLTKRSRDPELFTSDINDMSALELINHINKYRHLSRRRGRKMDIFDSASINQRNGNLKIWERWYLNISQFELYQHDDPAVESILRSLSSTPIVFSKQLTGGTQLKLKLTFTDDMEALWKPMRFTRDTETLRNHFYFNDFERHHAEIAGFHLDRILGFRRCPPVSGRILNITEDIKKHASSKFLKTVFTSPTGDECFYGKCSYYCDSNHAICGHPDWIEGSAAVFLPPDDIAPRDHIKSPWKRSYSRYSTAEWERDDNYCTNVKSSWQPYASGRGLFDLIDIHVFDFIQGNMDRHHVEIFDFPDDWKNNTSLIVLDNGRGWGKMYKDELSILAPVIQCCQIRHSTLQKLILFDEGPHKLSKLLDVSTSRDPLYPILAPGHLAAADRRVKIILKEVQKCIQKNAWDTVVIDDGF